MAEKQHQTDAFGIKLDSVKKIKRVIYPNVLHNCVELDANTCTSNIHKRTMAMICVWATVISKKKPAGDATVPHLHSTD